MSFILLFINMNLKRDWPLYLLVIIVFIFLVAISVVAVSGKQTEVELSTREQCELWEVKACKDYILEQKEIYSWLQEQMNEAKERADKAREVINNELDWLGLI